MKVLYFIENLGPGGKERRLVELIKKLSQYPDIDIEIVLMSKEIHYTDILDLDVRIHYAIRNKWKKDPRILFKFFNIVRKVKPDLIHVWGNMVAIYSLPARLLLGGVLINSQITDSPINVSFGLLGPKLTFPVSDKILANSYAGLKTYNAPTKKSSVIYNGFDFQRLANLTDKQEIRSKFNITTPMVVGMVATFYPKKDYATYLEAAQKVLETRTDVTFLCIGGGNAEPLKATVNPKWKSNILFLGSQSGVESIMNVCDIGVLCTNTHLHGEGISNALLEFCALGIPVLATDNGGTPEIIEHDQTGYLLKTHDSVDLTERLTDLLGDENKREQFGKAGQLLVQNKFSIQQMIDSFYKTYKELFK